VVVPINKISEFIDIVHSLESKTGVNAIAFGHAGDGNVHFCVLREQRTDTEWEDDLHRFLNEMYKQVTEMGGLVSGEHGIGLVKRRYFFANTAPETISLMTAVKQVFDPENILNPGVSYVRAKD
jgi:glycolate oxidase